jgi:hypothetical protein
MESTTKRNFRWKLSTVITFAIAGLAYLAWTSSWRGRFTVAWSALQDLRNLPENQVNDFFAAYDRLKVMPTGMPTEEDKKAIHDYVRT